MDRYLNAGPSTPHRPPILDSGLEDYWKKYRRRAALVVRADASATPLADKVALFWHGHFVSAQEKVGDATLMWQQIALFRAMGLGGFRALAEYAAVTPAMLRYLDNETNKVGRPQENFAREMWELFVPRHRQLLAGRGRRPRPGLDRSRPEPVAGQA